MQRTNAASSPWALPEGRAGQAVAIGLTLIAAMIAWFGLIVPVVTWYGDRNGHIALDQRIIAHEHALIGTLPAIRRRIASLGRTGRSVLLAGGSDAVAGAALQGDIQALATQTGINLDSAELLTTVKTGDFRRIPLRISLTTEYPKLIALLGAIAAASPRMLVDDVSLHATGLPDPGRDLPLRANFTISAFRAAGHK